MTDRTYFSAIEAADPDELDVLRRRRLDETIELAFELPFYRRLWEAHGLERSEFGSPEEFAARFPRVRKADLRAEIERRSSASIGIEATGNAPITNVIMTSSTSGWNTFASLTRDDLFGPGSEAQARELWTMDIRPGSRVLSVSPAWHGLGLYESRAITLIGAIAIVPWGSFGPRFITDILEAIRQLRPDHLLVPAPVLRALIVLCAQQESAPFPSFASVRNVGCAGEALSQAFRRDTIGALGLDDLFERGGSTDGMFGGAECWAHRGHHIPADHHYIEVVDPATGDLVPDGVRGSAVVTNLTGGRSLYVRFEPEDLAAIIPGRCPCGRTHPTVEFYGRIADCVMLDGRIVAPADIRPHLDEDPGFAGWPAVLSPYRDGLLISLPSHLEPDRPASERLCAKLEAELDVAVKVTFDIGDRTGWKEMQQSTDSPP